MNFCSYSFGFRAVYRVLENECGKRNMPSFNKMVGINPLFFTDGTKLYNQSGSGRRDGRIEERIKWIPARRGVNGGAGFFGSGTLMNFYRKCAFKLKSFHTVRSPFLGPKSRPGGTPRILPIAASILRFRLRPDIACETDDGLHPQIRTISACATPASINPVKILIYLRDFCCLPKPKFSVMWGRINQVVN